MTCLLSGFQLWNASISLFVKPRGIGSTGAGIWIDSAMIDTCRALQQCTEEIQIGFAFVTCMAFDPKFQFQSGEWFLPSSKKPIVIPAMTEILFSRIELNQETEELIYVAKVDL